MNENDVIHLAIHLATSCFSLSKQISWGFFAVCIFLYRFHYLSRYVQENDLFYWPSIFQRFSMNFQQVLFGKNWYILLFLNKWFFSQHTNENAKAAGIVHELNSLVSIWFNRLSYFCEKATKIRAKIDPVFTCLSALIILYSYFFLHFTVSFLSFSFCALK